MRGLRADLVLAWQIQRVEIMSMTKMVGANYRISSCSLATKTRGQTPQEQFALVHAMSTTYGIGLSGSRRSDGRYRPVE
jgi:hypothetical protein